MDQKPINSLKKHRVAKGISQELLAELSGCVLSTISKLESGGMNMTPTWARRLAPILEVRPYQLFDDIGIDEINEKRYNIAALNEELVSRLDKFHDYLLAQAAGKKPRIPS